ncbi:hypothetical protein Dda_3893 [Drechslerella dactyloides]|uniref:ACB domain-containing protein n=1 Tax=Drechslerella dactyloides TaxID=74499 RepID=A0AAD6J131_DREDA|nr:hypothetical protein Dda_3893 [Drechslerella dactyloides]
MATVDRVFVHALNTVKKLPRSGSSRPPPEDRMKLYGLYKQSMEGDVDGMVQRPTGTSDQEIMEARKWDSWHEQKGLSKTEAKRRYITTLIDLPPAGQAMHRYAITTPDARELVSELEFVWDQIKSNQNSPPPTTPQQPPRSQRPSTAVSAASTTPQRRHPLGLSHTHSQSVSAAGLQILPPMSPTDETAGGARFTTFPPIGMGVQTDDEEAGNRADNDNPPHDDDDDDDDGDEHYQTMDEFDENGLPKVTVISEPIPFKDALTAADILSPPRSVRTQTIAADMDTPNSKRRQQIHGASSPHSQPLTATRRSIAAALSSSSSAAAAAAAVSRTPNPHATTQNYARWKQRVEVALTKMTAELAAMREQLDVARTSAAAVNMNISRGISRGKLTTLRRWISWGVWMVMKHLVVDAVLLGVLVMWMRRRGDRRVEHVLGLLGGFLGERLRLRRGDTPEVTRTFVVA